jgi:hypothetical protein
MLNYIWLDDSKPILEQIQDKFNSVIIITNPFIQMPIGWTEKKESSPYERIYPTDEEVFSLGKPIKWSEILKSIGFTNYGEVALALKTCISALKKQYAREDLAEKLMSSMTDDLYFPNEDQISQFFIEDIIRIFQSIGVRSVEYSDPINDVEGEIELSEATSIDIFNLAPKEIIITDKLHRFAFMSVYDSFITLMCTNIHNPLEIVEQMGWDAIICTEDTKINWYLC